MIFPTLRVQVLRKTANDRYGQSKTVRAFQEKVAPVKLDFSVETTTVRTDSSGSHGSGRERIADVVLLAVPRSKIVEGDVLELTLPVLGTRRVKVTGLHPRFAVTGAHDHTELHCQVHAA